MSQHPKIGPFSPLHEIANCGKLRSYLSFKDKEKMKESLFLSATHCFLFDFHSKAEYPPITFPNYVSTKTIVCGILSQILWNYPIEKLC